MQAKLSDMTYPCDILDYSKILVKLIVFALTASCPDSEAKKNARHVV
jgi:hypothetical protein